MNELALFGSTFMLVFALGLQSLNVNGGHYWWAFFTSFVIGGANLVLYKLAPDASTSEAFAYLAGGPFGIVFSMWVHRRWIRPRAEERRAREAREFESAVLRYIGTREQVTTHAVIKDALSIPPKHRTSALANQVCDVLHRAGWVKHRANPDGGWTWRRAPALERRRHP